MPTDKLKEQLRRRKLENMIDQGRRKVGYNYSRQWHPSFKKLRKDIARMETELNARKRAGK